MLERIYNHPSASTSVRELVVNHSLLNSELVHNILKVHPLSDKEVLAVLKHPSACSEEIRQVILGQKSLNETQFTEILHHCQSDKTLELIYNHPKADSQICELVLQHQLLSPALILNLLRTKSFTEHELSLILRHPKAGNEAILRALLMHNTLTEGHLIEILQRVQNEEIVEQVYNHPSVNTKIREHLLQHPSLPLQVLLNILKCSTISDEEIMLVLKNPILFRDQFLCTALNTVPLKKMHFQELLNHHFSRETMVFVYNHPSVTPDIHQLLLQHPRLHASYLLKNNTLPDNEMMLLLQHPTAINNDLLEEISRKPSLGYEVLLALITHEKAEDYTLFCAVNHRVFDLKAAVIILERKNIPEYLLFQLAHKIFELNDNSPQWEECIEEIIKQAKAQNASKEMKEIIQEHIAALSTKTALKFLNTMGKDALANVSLNFLIQKATKEDLNILISHDIQLNRAELSELAKKNLDTQQIDKLLAHPSMLGTVADILFKKPAYSGEIKNWQWLTKDQFKATLDRTKDYNSLKIAFEHLPKKTLEQWYEHKRSEHQTALKSGLVSTKIRDKLFCALNELKLKSLSHSLKAMDNPKYEQAAESSFTLYQKLHAETEHFLNNPHANAAAFRTNCENAINNAKPVLEQHRGFKQILLDIVNVLFAVTALFRNGNWRLFEAKTASMRTVNKVLQNMDELIEHTNQNVIPPTA
jgi:hypothetical protein